MGNAQRADHAACRDPGRPLPPEMGNDPDRELPPLCRRSAAAQCGRQGTMVLTARGERAGDQGEAGMSEIRKIITMREMIFSELGAAAARPTVRAAGIAVIRN